MIDSGQEVRWGCSGDLRIIAKNFNHELPVPLADAIAGWLFDHVFPWVEHYGLIGNLPQADKNELVGWIRRDASEGNPQAQKLYADYLGLLEEHERDNDLTPTDYAAAGQYVLNNLRQNQKNRGLCPVCHRPATVPEQVCENPAPSNGDGDKMAVVAVPSGHAGNPPDPQ